MFTDIPMNQLVPPYLLAEARIAKTLLSSWAQHFCCSLHISLVCPAFQTIAKVCIRQSLLMHIIGTQIAMG